jgi:hypothetical protein
MSEGDRIPLYVPLPTKEAKEYYEKLLEEEKQEEDRPDRVVVVDI